MSNRGRQDALDLRAFHSTAAFVLREQQFNADAQQSRRRRSSARDNTLNTDTGRPILIRRRMAPPGSNLTLRPGIVLFDPKDLEPSDRRGSGEWRQQSLRLELQEPPETDDDLDEAEDAEDDNQRSHDVEDEDAEESPARQHERQRARVIQEICETEKSYVRDIRSLHDHYIVALEDNKHPVMEDAQIAVFFNNLRQLVMLNSKLLTDLLEIMERRAAARKLQARGRAAAKPKSVKSPVSVALQYDTEGVGAVFCRYAPLFKLYGGYAKDFEEVAELLRSYGRDTRLGFSRFLDTCRERSSSSKPFESLLIMPIQRIPRYKLLLQRVCELTPAEHPDAGFLTEAVARVSAAASLINETVRRQENLETVLQAQQQFVGQLSLFTSDRRLLKAGRLTKMSTKRPEEVMLHLFNDILLYSGVLITGGYRERRRVHLRSKAVGVKTELPTAICALFEQQSRRRVRRDCGFVVTSREKTFILFAETPEAQREWVDAIAAAARDAQQQQQQNQTPLGDAGDRGGNNVDSCESPAALWMPDEFAGACTICHASFRVYFRRHHCRRCGAVVCGNCSSRRSPLFVGDSARAERVCSPCFQLLDLVRQVAMHWLSRLVEFRGVLRRRRWNKWNEHYFELRAGVLKQFTLETGTATSGGSAISSATASGFSGSGSGASVLGGSAISGANSGSSALRCCTDELALAGAIVIHRSDSRAQKNRYCFQISTSEYDEANAANNNDNAEDAPSTCDKQKASPVRRRLSQPAIRPHLMSKLSPLKQAVSRFGDVVSRGRDSANPSGGASAAWGEGSFPLASPPPSHAVTAPSPSSSLLSSSSSVMTTMSSMNDSEWILCAASLHEEVAWRDALQRSADKALHRMRRSRVTESSFPLSLAQNGRLSLSLSLPQTSVRASMFVATGTAAVSALSGRRRMSSLDRGRSTDAELALELAQATGEDRDEYLLERRRRQILKEIIRSEESYVECLGECIRLFVQPLLLRQLEGRQMYRRYQNRRRRSMRPVFGGPSTPSARIGVAGRGHRRTGSSGSVGVSGTGGSSSSLHSVLSASYGAAAAAASSASSTLSSASSSAPKLLVMNADMAIFFSSVDQICTLNQQLLDHLSRHLEETSAVPPLPPHAEDELTIPTDSEDGAGSGIRVHRAGAIFHAYAPLLQLYTSYASRHSAALSALDSPQFAGFLRELPAEADENRLRRYLNMPVERIPRYKMLLQELLGSTPPEHVDYAPLQSAIRSVDRVANKIEEISARRENARTLAAVGAKVGLDLRGRRFVRDGTLRKVCRSKVQKYYFVLLEDAMVYGRQGGGLQKKKFRLIDLWECKVSEDTEAMPGVITIVANSNNAFCFYSPLKSFILLAESEADKASWTASILDCISRNLRGQTHPRRASVRSELLLDNDQDSASGYDLESAFVIKNGWINVSSGAATSNATSSRSHGSSLSPSPSSSGKKPRRLWITLTLQSISLASTFKAAQPEETIPIELCEVAPLPQDKSFRLQFLRDPANPETPRAQTSYVFETQAPAERGEWVRALTHCISGGDEQDLRRRSINAATLAPIFMFDKVSNVCTICTHSFAVYRPRHHCRLCGSLVCGNCSKRRWALSYSSSKKASRICDSCAESAMTGSFAAEV